MAYLTEFNDKAFKALKANRLGIFNASSEHIMEYILRKKSKGQRFDSRFWPTLIFFLTKHIMILCYMYMYHVSATHSSSFRCPLCSGKEDIYALNRYTHEIAWFACMHCDFDFAVDFEA